MQTKHIILTWVMTFAAASIAGCGGDNPVEGVSLIIENPYEAADQEGGVPISFEPDGSFGAEDTPENEILASASNAAVDEAGNVYVLDGRSRIVSFDPGGSLRWQMTAEGEGPGELNQAWGMVLGPDDLLYVNNQTATRIDVYDLQGRHVRAISPESFGHNRFVLAGFPNDSTAVGTLPWFGHLGASILVANTGDEWTTRRRIDIDQSEGVDMPEGMASSSNVGVFDGQLAVTHVSRYEIALMSLEGDTLRLIRRDVPDYTRPGFHQTTNTITLRSFSSTSIPVVLPTGHRLVEASWPTNVSDPDAYTEAAMNDNAPEIDYHRTLDLYDSDWKLVYSIDGDEYDRLGLGSPELVDASGRLYTSRSTPWPRLDRYILSSTNE